MRIGCITILLMVLVACDTPQRVEAVDPQDVEAWMLAHADTYRDDRAWRRAELEASLWRPELPYSRKRLGSYALPDGGWDALPTLSADVAPVTTGGGSEAYASLIPEVAPTTVEQWRALGEEVFWKLPMRRDAYLQWIVTQPQLWSQVGLEADESGKIRGLTRYRDLRGRELVAMTCGLCHGAEGVAGRAHRGVDLGMARVLYSRAMGREPGIYDTWGPGRVDVTDDDVADPLAIADLWGVSHQSHINSSGSIERASPATLAIRFETQYVEGHSMETRPDRTLVWALALFVQTLERPDATAANMDKAGAEVFARRCASCHDPDRGYSGDLVSAETLNSDPQAAFSVKRGTGYYKTPSLLGVGQGGPYLHDGSQPSLSTLLASGHPYGEALSREDRDALEDFLKDL